MKTSIRLFCLILVLAVCTVSFGFAETAAPREPLVVDLDLSVMSGTIVYAQIWNIVSNPDEFLGKVIKMAGYYSYFEDQALGMVYHACIVPDATACCAQGIEFIWAEDHPWPDEYPEFGTDITVTGRLEKYEENGILYLHLVDAELTWEQPV